MNIDETGHFYKRLPNKALTFMNDSGHGRKSTKEREAVLVGANMIGKEKLMLLVIEKSKQPRCFKGGKSLEVNYCFDKKAGGGLKAVGHGGLSDGR
ncbi:hypothetical protein, partial [Klebsiella pneumoniae]|uniref:hypothetical protein n=1 Tax=Klebsiella pneumoniae TaxID=573 RepID=UPI0040559A50